MSKSRLELVPYSRSHLTNFKPGRFDRASTTQLRLEQGWDGKAVSAIEDGETLGITGISVKAGKALVWIVMSDELRRRPVALCRMAKASLPNVLALPGVETVEVEVDPEFPEARRWAEWLGFRATGTRRMVHGGGNSISDD